MPCLRLKGLVAATLTPLHDDGSLNLDQVGPIVDHLLGQGVEGLYVCGSTGEGISLMGAERKAVARAYVEAAHHQLPVVVQVGHNSLSEAHELARHAQEIGADAISANAPSYFKVGSVESLVACMRKIASGAPDLPFFYYHIPHLTGAHLNMLEFLEQASQQIPNLAGIKYTSPTLHEYQCCLEWKDGAYGVLWGCDEMLLPALAVGATGAVGSTYNIAASLYTRMIEAFQDGNLDTARRCQSLAIRLINVLYEWPFHAALKEVMRMLGLDCGPCRLPHPELAAEDVRRLRTRLEAIQFFDWCRSQTWDVNRVANDTPTQPPLGGGN